MQSLMSDAQSPELLGDVAVFVQSLFHALGICIEKHSPETLYPVVVDFFFIVPPVFS